MDKSNLNKISLARRRVLYVGAFLIFFIAGPIITLYASGYRLDMRNTRLAKVGAFYIKSYPAGSFISLDGKPTRKKTPNRIFNILPGFHTIQVSRAGYESWQKTLEINPGETNFIRDIIFFKKNTPPQLLSNGGSNLLVATTNEFYIFLDAKKKIHLTNILTNDDYIISDLSFDKLLSLSSDNTKLLVSNGSHLLILDINTEQTQSALLPAGTPITKASWGTGTDGYWLLSQRRLYWSDAISKTISDKFNDIDDFVHHGATLYTVSVGKGSALVNAYDSSTLKSLWKKEIQTSDTVSLGDVSPDGIVVVVGQHSLWIYDHNADEITAFDAKEYEWHNQKLLYSNSFEVYVYDTANKNNELIDRASKQTIDIHWHPSGSYILRQLDSEFELIELDGRDVRNRIFIANATSTPTVIFDKKGSRLYVLTATQNLLYEIQ